jgi:hypothetical protein
VTVELPQMDSGFLGNAGESCYPRSSHRNDRMVIFCSIAFVWDVEHLCSSESVILDF